MTQEDFWLMKPKSYLKTLAAREIRKTAPSSPKSAVKGNTRKSVEQRLSKTIRRHIYYCHYSLLQNFLKFYTKVYRRLEMFSAGLHHSNTFIDSVRSWVLFRMRTEILRNTTLEGSGRKGEADRAQVERMIREERGPRSEALGKL